MQRQPRLAVDIGGTFTDIVLEIGGELVTRKVLTTIARPEEAVLQGSAAVLREAGIGFADVGIFVHGTTLATNAVLERRGAKTALIATDGFRDVLEIATESRYDQYDLSIELRSPLVQRHLRFTVPERVDASGKIILPLDERMVAKRAKLLKEADVESVAISFLHSYANPAHEMRTREILRDAMPDLAITLSCEVCPEIREYERTSTAVANAFVQPLIDGYLQRMSKGLAEAGFHGMVYLVASSGGLTSIETARRFPVRLIESGPAGGAIFASYVADRLGETRALAFDMGGTTAKVCLIDDFTPQSERVYEVDRAAKFLKYSGLPLRIPVIDLIEIGAGGGSIACVNSLGSVAVGPESAGSEPGPACYARGGLRPTVTDADVVLGVIDPKSFAGGTISLDVEASSRALNSDVAGPLAISAQMAAFAVNEMVCESMAGAARAHAVEKGKSLGEYTLISFGGAAPVHASRVAEKLGVDRIVIPANAGVGSAVGFLKAAVSFEIVKSRHELLGSLDAPSVSKMLSEMSHEARGLVEQGASGVRLTERRQAFMRYVGQGHEIAIELPDGDLSANSGTSLRVSFEQHYGRMFGRFIPGAPIEVMSWSVLISTIGSRPERHANIPLKTETVGAQRRQSYFDGQSGTEVEIPVFRREELFAGALIPGPALIAERETTTFVSDTFDARIDGAGNIVMNRKNVRRSREQRAG